MAHIVDNPKGFKVIFFTTSDLYCIGSPGICDFCNDVCEKEGGYYIAVLGQALCQKCYDDWMKHAIRYEEDAKYEDRNFETYRQIFNL